jgi:hypothetical protein
MRAFLRGWLASIVLGLFVSCNERPASVRGNEGLRLAPDQIPVLEKAAQGGDANAAKKLWHHFTFVEGDLDKGEMWRKTYENLTKKNN